MPKTVTVKMKEIRKSTQKRNTDDVEEVRNISGTRNWQATTRDQRELRWNVLEVKVHRNCEV
jgi:hypothetical protein